MELKAIVRKIKRKGYYYGRIQVDSVKLKKLVGKVVVLNIPDDNLLEKG